MKKGRIQPGKNTPVKTNDKKVVTGKGLIGFKNNKKVNQTMSKVRKATGKTEADLKRMSESELKRASTSKMKTSSKPLGLGAPGKSSSKTSTAQAGDNIKKSGGKNYNVGVSKGGVSFGEAFKHFKNKGVKEFTWNDKRYTTKTKDGS